MYFIMMSPLKFGIFVVPEFGMVAVLIMGVSIFIVILYFSFNKTLTIKR